MSDGSGAVTEARGRPAIWGIVNVTPDSFSDGGLHLRPADAIEHGRRLLEEGADVLDVGGESTRPGAAPVAREEEIARVVPVVEALAGEGARVGIDTRHATVAAAALGAGARIVNDVSAGADPAMFGVAAGRGAELVLMHMRGTPRTMQEDPRYGDVVAEVAAHLEARAAAAEEAGIPRDHLWIDPGIGFGKTLEHNLALLRDLERFVAGGVRVLLGASRKSFLGTLTDEPVAARRLASSLACALRAAEAGAHAVRVHDVKATRDALEVFRQIR